MLFLTTQLDYLTALTRCIFTLSTDCQRMKQATGETYICSVVYDLADAFMEHPSATVRVWGPGFVGYDDRLTVPKNIRQRYPCGELDLIFVFLGE